MGIEESDLTLVSYPLIVEGFPVNAVFVFFLLTLCFFLFFCFFSPALGAFSFSTFQGGVEKHRKEPKPWFLGGILELALPRPLDEPFTENSRIISPPTSLPLWGARSGGTHKEGGTEPQGGRPLHVPRSSPRGQVGSIARSEMGLMCSPPQSHSHDD